MSKITRQGTNKILSSSVEYHNFVYLAGMTADDLSKDIKGQTAEVLAKIDAHLAACGSDKSRILRVQSYLANIADIGGMNAVWDAWVGGKDAPARATGEAKLATPAYKVEIIVVAARD